MSNLARHHRDADASILHGCPPDLLKDVTDLLSHNRPPSDKESAYLACVQAEATAALETLEAQITQLVKERDEWLAKQDRCQSIMSRLRDLPVEILRIVFTRLLQSVMDELEKNSVSSTAPMWTLSHVSRHWRAVALETPSLWSVIGVSKLTPGKRGSLNLLNTQLSRTGSEELFVSIHVDDVVPSTLIQQGIITVWRQVPSRCTVLKLGMMEGGLKDLISSTPSPTFDKLHTLFLSAPRFPDLNTFFKHSPNLSVLGAASSLVSDFDLPWSNLRELHGYPSIGRRSKGAPADHISVLSRASNLKVCHMESWDSDTPTAEVTAPDLTTFSFVTLQFSPSQPSIYDSLRLPSLTSLRVNSEIPPESLQRFITASGCTTETLFLVYTDTASIVNCRHLLDCMPSIKHLSLVFPHAGTRWKDVSEELFPAFQPGGTRPLMDVYPSIKRLGIYHREQLPVKFAVRLKSVRGDLTVEKFFNAKGDF